MVRVEIRCERNLRARCNGQNGLLPRTCPTSAPGPVSADQPQSRYTTAPTRVCTRLSHDTEYHGLSLGPLPAPSCSSAGAGSSVGAVGGGVNADRAVGTCPGLPSAQVTEPSPCGNSCRYGVVGWLSLDVHEGCVPSPLTQKVRVWQGRGGTECWAGGRPSAELCVRLCVPSEPWHPFGPGFAHI